MIDDGGLPGSLKRGLWPHSAPIVAFGVGRPHPSLAFVRGLQEPDPLPSLVPVEEDPLPSDRRWCQQNPRRVEIRSSTVCPRRASGRSSSFRPRHQPASATSPKTHQRSSRTLWNLLSGHSGVKAQSDSPVSPPVDAVGELASNSYAIRVSRIRQSRTSPGMVNVNIAWGIAYARAPLCMPRRAGNRSNSRTQQDG